MKVTNRVWAAVIVPVGVPDVFGGMWDVDQLFWTCAAAVAGVERHATHIMGLMPVAWSRPEDRLLIGRTHMPGDPSKAYAILVRSVLLP